MFVGALWFWVVWVLPWVVVLCWWVLGSCGFWFDVGGYWRLGLGLRCEVSLWLT